MTNKYAYKVASLSSIYPEDRRILMGNTGIFLTQCGGDPDLAKSLLEEALSLSSDPEVNAVYEDLLDYLYETYPRD